MKVFSESQILFMLNTKKKNAQTLSHCNVNTTKHIWFCEDGTRDPRLLNVKEAPAGNKDSDKKLLQVVNKNICRAQSLVLLVKGFMVSKITYKVSRSKYRKLSVGYQVSSLSSLKTDHH